jgi:putative glycosyltransferase (TIGR04372 family)
MLSSLQFSGAEQPNVVMVDKHIRLTSNKTSIIIDAIYELYLSFVNSFRIRSELINKHLGVLEQIPELLTEVLLFSDYDTKTCLESYKKMARLAIDSRFLLRLEHLISAGEASLRLGFQYIDLFEVKPSLSSLKELNLFESMYGPHIGISFGHPSFLFETSLALLVMLGDSNLLDIRNSCDEKKVRLIYDPSISASYPIEFGTNCLTSFIHKKESSIPINPCEYNNLYLGDTYVRFKSLLALDAAGARTILSSDSIKISDSFMNCSAIPCDGIASKDISLLNFIDAATTPIIRNLTRYKPRIIAIHTRDGAYSGSGQEYRNSNFNDYVPLVKHLIKIGYVVVRISRAAEPCNFSDNSFIDLSKIKCNLADQLEIMRQVELIIGTASGISHWSILFNKPIMYVNCAALPCSGILERHMHSPKRIELDLSACTNLDRDDLIKRTLSSSWSFDLVRKLGCRCLSQRQLIEDTMYTLSFISGEERTIYTSHMLLSLLNIDSTSIPDYRFTPSAFHNLYSQLRRLMLNK